MRVRREYATATSTSNDRKREREIIRAIGDPRSGDYLDPSTLTFACLLFWDDDDGKEHIEQIGAYDAGLSDLRREAARLDIWGRVLNTGLQQMLGDDSIRLDSR